MNSGPRPSRAVVADGGVTQLLLNREFPIKKRSFSFASRFRAEREKAVIPSSKMVVSPPCNMSRGGDDATPTALSSENGEQPVRLIIVIAQSRLLGFAVRICYSKFKRMPRALAASAIVVVWTFSASMVF